MSPKDSSAELDLFKPTTISLTESSPKKVYQPARKAGKFKIDRIKKTPEKLLRAKTLPMPQDLPQPELSNNAKMVLKERYLKKDQQGRVQETPRELFWRVASNLAQADRLYQKKPDLKKTAREFYEVMAKTEFLPNSPCLRGAGRKMQQLSACFTKNQKILSNPGYKDIFKIKIGDKVVTHLGKMGRVIKTYKRRYQGKLYSINVRGLIKPTLSVTEEHPVLALKKEELACKRNCPLISRSIQPKWIPVKELKRHDYVVVNTNQEKTDTKEIDIEDYISDDIYLKEDDYLLAKGRLRQGKLVPNRIIIDNDFMRLAGYWLADGSLSERDGRYATIRFTFNPKERSFCREIKKIIKDKFNLRAKEEFIPKQRTIQLRLNSAIVAGLFYNLLGKGANGKRIPEWMMTLPPEKQFNLMVGLFKGGGCYHRSKRQNLISVSLSNERLASDVWNILLRLGYNFNISYQKPKPATRLTYKVSSDPSECKDLIRAIQKERYQRKRKFPHYIKRDGFILRPIDRIESREFSGDVFNLEVEGDHSYLANGVAVHNCFVLPIEDSLESILTSLKHACFIFKTGGGCGYSFSRLRPQNDKISTTGNNAGGPVSFLKVYNATIGEITQGGVRMGANMGMLRCDHPDIEKFIEVKNDNTSITNFNISVSATDEFMEAVEQGRDYELINPRNNKATKTVNAREIFNKIVENAWRNGDPGMIFLDRINDSTSNPVKSIGMIEATNPCLTGDTWVTTPEGPFQIYDLVGKTRSLLLDGRFQATNDKGFFSTGRKKIYEIQTERGYSLKATSNHLIKTIKSLSRHKAEFEWKPVDKLKPNDLVALSNNKDVNWRGKGSFGEGYLLGILFGDGALGKRNATISIWGDNKGSQAVRREIERWAFRLPHRSDFNGFQRKIKERPEYRLRLRSIHLLAERYGFTPGEKKITPEIESAGRSFYQGFLRGFFDASGSVQGTQRKDLSISLAQSNLETLQAVQRMLLRLGIASTIYKGRRPGGKDKLPDGIEDYKEYIIKAQHKLVITDSNLSVFASAIGFSEIEKREKLLDRLSLCQASLNRERFLTKIDKIIPRGSQEVFDVQVPKVNAFSANGMIVHNCGEQPLLPYESCVLGSINLAKFVSEGAISWSRLKKTVQTAMHLLDNIIDMNIYTIPEIEEISKGLRRTGLGVMGFADMLIKLGIPYNSAEGIEMGEKVMEFINTEAKIASQRLAEERGAYPYFKKSDDSKRGDSPLRNVARTTIAPTGTISVIGDCSSGIEPIYALVHKRKSIWDKKGPKVELLVIDKNFKRIIKERGLYDDELMERISASGSIAKIDSIPEQIRKVFVTAHDLSPIDHIKVQAAFQRHTDNAISKTINFPNSATVEDVKEAYLTAYRMGCKGITIYRDGSRDIQVLTVGDKGKAEIPAVPVKITPRERPEVVTGSTEKIRTGMGNLFITINEDREGLFEVFAQIGKSGGDAGALVEAIARLISISLRSRIPVDIIIEQLKGIRGSNPVWRNGELILSPPDAIGKALERYLAKQKELRLVWKDNKRKEATNQPKITANIPSAQVQTNLCPECGDQMIYEEGCIKCPSCKLSKCG
jgi:ribonucleoside-diphosphate reductase alpha chain